MKYNECLQVLSPARLNKYAQACSNDKAKTLRLYQYNIKLSQRFYGVIGMFEIMLRMLSIYTIKVIFMTPTG